MTVRKGEKTAIKGPEGQERISPPALPVGTFYAFHGTTTENAEAILVEGFRPDSWFALDIANARAVGGPTILCVEFTGDPATWKWDEEDLPIWQFHHPGVVPVSQIVEVIR